MKNRITGLKCCKCCSAFLWMFPLLLFVASVTSACSRQPASEPVPTLAEVISTPTETAAPPAASPSATAVPVEIPLLTWNQLKNATYLIPPEAGGPENGLIPMQNGGFSYAPVPGSASESQFFLYPGVAFGDLNTDGIEDAAVVIVNISAGTGNFYHLVPVLNDGGLPQPLAPTIIGDRVVVEQLTVDEALVDLTFRTYRPEEAFGSTPTLRVSRQYRLNGEGLEEEGEQVLNADEVVAASDFDQPVQIEMPEEGGTLRLKGAAGSFGLDQYQLQFATGQNVTISVSSPNDDTFLSIFCPESAEVLASARDEVTSYQGSGAETEHCAINIFSIGTETEYLLIIEAAAPPAEPISGGAPVPPAAVSGEGENLVYLTFDDGPAPSYTLEILSLLNQYGAKATFFLLGVNGQSYGDLLETIRQSGHTLGNHTWSHRSLAGISQVEFNQEIQSTAELLGPSAAPCMRPPYGATDAFTRAYAAELGYEVIMWNIDTLDWSQPGTGAIVSSVLSNVYPGAIVLMHDGGGSRTQTVAALETVLSELSSQGYVFEALCQ